MLEYENMARNGQMFSYDSYSSHSSPMLYIHIHIQITEKPMTKSACRLCDLY